MHEFSQPMDSGEPHTLSPLEFDAHLADAQPRLRGYLAAILGAWSDVDDLVQETNLVLCRKVSEFEAGTNFRAWAFRVAYWQTMAHLKRVQRAGLVTLEPDVLDLIAQDAEEQLADFDDRNLALKSCLQKLPPGDTSILLAHYQSGESLAEISGRLGRSREALKQVLLRIRRTLRLCIERQIASESNA
jgi:RNA polymerase sigma-70 factor (ECF subfamily)